MRWKEQDRQAEDSTAHLYDYLYNRTHFAHTMYRQFAETITSHVSNGRVLELACGTGTVSKLIGETGLITYGIDHSIRMVEIAKARVDYCEVGDIENLPFGDDYFDAVFVHSALHHFPSLEQIIREARRVLKPSHLFFIQEPNKHHIRASGAVRALRYAARHFVEKYPDVSHLEVKPSEVHDTITMDQVIEPLKQAGFTILKKEYRYYASWLLNNFDSMTLHKIGLVLDSGYIAKSNDGYMFMIIAQK